MINTAEIILVSEEDAETVRDVLLRVQASYGFVTLGDYMELVSLSTTFAEQQVGWTELNEIQIKPVEGGFTLDLPEPKKL